MAYGIYNKGLFMDDEVLVSERANEEEALAWAALLSRLALEDMCGGGPVANGCEPDGMAEELACRGIDWRNWYTVRPV